MRGLGIAIAAGALLTGTSALAQTDLNPEIETVSPFAFNEIRPGTPRVVVALPPGGFVDNLSPDVGSGNFPNTSYGSPSGRALWEATSTQNAAGTITFESANALSGDEIRIDSYSGVNLRVRDGGGLSLHSTITPAGMGFYVANVSGGCIQTGTCPQVDPLSTYDFTDFAAVADGAFAHVEFDFQVFSNFVPPLSFEGPLPLPTSLYGLQGSMTLGVDGSLIIFENLGNAIEVLGAQQDTPFADCFTAANCNDSGNVGTIGFHSLGYSWGETAFDTSTVLPGYDLQTVTYVARVSSDSRTPCLSGRGGVDLGVTACLIAYAGFGDPIGAGDIDAFSLLGGVMPFNHGVNSSITRLNFGSFTIETPQIRGGQLVIGDAVGGPPGIPEPATWAMMIMGFGFLGTVLRRRRAYAHA